MCGEIPHWYNTLCRQVQGTCDANEHMIMVTRVMACVPWKRLDLVDVSSRTRTLRTLSMTVSFSSTCLSVATDCPIVVSTEDRHQLGGRY